ncbi:MAG TPA: polymer-forming cytoskeletal protein [Candidatus Baltobacteraceae bacterium]|nr:polymer-forming cytoskeletal protein [Candidatus Baltobacteraceae bacterium]
MKFSTAAWLLGALVFTAALLSTSQAALADAKSVDHGGTYVGSVVVEPGQTVEGTLNVLFGNATIEGTVDGDVNVVGGDIDVHGGNVTGQTHVISNAVTQTIVPWAPSAESYGSYQPDHRMWWRIAWDVVALVMFLIFPLRSRMALDRLEQHPAMATLGGLCGLVAVFPVSLLLLFSIILIPLIPVEFVLLAAAVFIGKAALALLVGRRFYELLQPKSTPAPLLALIIGLVLLTAAELVPVLGIMVTLLIILVGLGAVLLTFVPDWHTVGPSGTPPRPVIGGPPMPLG